MEIKDSKVKRKDKALNIFSIFYIPNKIIQKTYHNTLKRFADDIAISNYINQMEEK